MSGIWRMATVTAVLTLAACGGGGGGGSELRPTTNPPPTFTPTPTPPPEPPTFAPIPMPSLTSAQVSYDLELPLDYASNEPIWLNVGEIPVLIGTLEGIVNNARTERSYTQDHGTARVGHASANDGVPLSRIINYLKTEFISQDEFTGQYEKYEFVHRWGSTPPAVRMVPDGSSEEEREQNRRDILMAVRMINSALPPEWQLSIDETYDANLPLDWKPTPAPDDGTEDTRTTYEKWGVYKDFIDIQFRQYAQWPRIYRRDKDSTTVRGVAYVVYDENGGQVHGTRIFVDPARADNTEKRLHVLLHEILHALGRTHVRLSDNFDSVMISPAPDKDWTLLDALDIATLRAVYAGLDHNVETETLTASDFEFEFGEWSNEALHVYGRLPHTDDENLFFGAVLRNALPRPYVLGMDPAPALTGNVGDSASWRGRLLGLTPDAKTVGGAMAMMVTFGSVISGDIDFTNLEYWAANSGPGAISSGTEWGDGDLHYDIRVDEGEVFVETGSATSDEGQITGRFFGDSHEGAAGTLKRDDLAAGFGGVKQ